MKYIEESIDTKVPSTMIWNAWAQNYWNNETLQMNKTGNVKTGKGRGVKYKIIEMKENQSFTIVWHSLFVKLVFTHSVQPSEKGSIITCRVNFKGIMSFLVKALLEKKIKKYLAESLTTFAKQLESR